MDNSEFPLMAGGQEFTLNEAGTSTMPPDHATISLKNPDKITVLHRTSNIYDEIDYVVVRKDKSEWRLDQRNDATPKELIGINKFLTAIALFAVHVPHRNDAIHWTRLINNLGIARHFIPMTRDHAHHWSYNITLMDPD